MATLNEAPRYGKEYRFGIVPEASFGAVPASGQGPVCELRCDPIALDRNVTIREVRGAQGSMIPVMNERVQNMSGSMPTFTLTVPFCCVDPHSSMSPGELLAKSHFQYAAGSVCSYFDTHPNKNDRGVYSSYTMMIKSPVSGRDIIIPGCVNKSFDLNFAQGDAVTLSCDVVGYYSTINYNLSSYELQMSGSLGVSGTNQEHGAPVANFSDFTYEVGIDGAAVGGVTCTAANIHCEYDEVVQLSPTGNGTYYNRGFHGMNNCTFSVTMLRDDVANSADTAFATGQPIQLTITAGTGLATNWDLTDIWCTGKIDSIENNLDGLDTVTIACKMMAFNTSSNMIEIDFS